MIPSGVQVFVALEPVNMRLSFDRLSGIALEHIGYDVQCGALFIFFGKRQDAVKILFADGSGICLFYKRLNKGRYRLPAAEAPGAKHVELDESLLDALLDGVDLEPAPRTGRKRKRPRKDVDVH